MFFMILRMPGEKLVLQLFSRMLSTSRIAGFFDHQYLWTESFDVSVFLHGVSYQGNVASETTLLVGCGQVILSSNLIARIFLSTILN